VGASKGSFDLWGMAGCEKFCEKTILIHWFYFVQLSELLYV
jgi:hypothetical protein